MPPEAVLPRGEYRADIQALRAVAVAAAVLFHSGLPVMSAGFYGVDIFFVISGFLITGIILRELESTGRIDVWAFWTRRAWRLLPNALALLIAALALVAFVGPVSEQRAGALDIASAAVNAANYRFVFRSLDYYDDTTGASPVLHFWSLSVEEQFYLLWPLLLLAVWTSSRASHRGLAAAAMTVAAASFAIALYWAARSQPDAFFRTEARIWELAIGAAAAISARGLNLNTSQQALAWLCGWIGIIVSLSGVHQRLDAPFWFVVLPVISATFVLIGSARRYGAAHAVVAFKPLQWLGDRSYSIYLWHWPVLLYGGRLVGDTLVAKAVLLLAVLAISAIAYRTIEQPFRHGRKSAHGEALTLRWLAVPFLLLLAGVGAVQFTTLDTSGERITIAKRIRDAQADSTRITNPACPKGWEADANTDCRFGSQTHQRPLAVLLGDSYAHHLFDGADAAARRAGWSLLVLTRASCPPVDAPVMNERTGVADIACRNWFNAVMQRLESIKPDLVLISSWEGAAKQMAGPASGKWLETAASERAWRDGFTRSLLRLQSAGIRTVVIPSTPRGRFADLEKCMSLNAADQCGRPKLGASVHGRLAQDAARNLGTVRILDLLGYFCGKNVCYSVRNGRIVYRDRSHHITAAFSRSLEPAFFDVLQSRP